MALSARVDELSDAQVNLYMQYKDTPWQQIPEQDKHIWRSIERYIKGITNKQPMQVQQPQQQVQPQAIPGIPTPKPQNLTQGMSLYPASPIDNPSVQNAFEQARIDNSGVNMGFGGIPSPKAPVQVNSPDQFDQNQGYVDHILSPQSTPQSRPTIDDQPVNYDNQFPTPKPIPGLAGGGAGGPRRGALMQRLLPSTDFTQPNMAMQGEQPMNAYEQPPAWADLGSASERQGPQPLTYAEKRIILDYIFQKESHPLHKEAPL